MVHFAEKLPKEKALQFVDYNVLNESSWLKSGLTSQCGMPMQLLPVAVDFAEASACENFLDCF